MGGSGDSMSGTFSGHFIPAVFFLSFTTFYLSLTFRRMCALARSSSSSSSEGGVRCSLATSFCQHYIPESNLRLVRTLSWILMLSTSFGIIFEGVGATIVNYQHAKGNSFFTNATHQTLYLLFFVSGLAGVFESHGCLPPDSLRGGLVVALGGETILWHEHALMKTNHVDARLHSLLALITFSDTALFALSICKPTNMLLYVASLCGFILQGTWLVTAAINTFHPIDAELVGVYFVLQVLGLVFVTMLATVYVNGLEKRHQQGGGGAAGVAVDGDSCCEERRLALENTHASSSDKVQYEKLQNHNVDDDQDDDNDQTNEFDFA